jgi:DNA-binding SARP family transcriptional activator
MCPEQQPVRGSESRRLREVSAKPGIGSLIAESPVSHEEPGAALVTAASDRTSGKRESISAQGGLQRQRSLAEVRLLNSFDLRLDGESVVLALPAQRLLAFLALADRPAVRAAVAGKLWLEGTEAHALGSLRSALWRLRRLRCDLIDASNRRLELFPDVLVDVRALISWSRLQLDGIASDEDDLKYIRMSGELLPDWYDDWVVLERERLREVRVRALEALCDRLAADGFYHRATEAALAAIKADPLRESAYRCLIRVHIDEGNDGDAVRCYRVFRKLMLDQLGLEPSTRMEELIRTVMV